MAYGRSAPGIYFLRLLFLFAVRALINAFPSLGKTYNRNYFAAFLMAIWKPFFYIKECKNFHSLVSQHFKAPMPSGGSACVFGVTGVIGVTASAN